MVVDLSPASLHKEAEKRAWATVNKMYGGGGKKGGSGSKTVQDNSPAIKGGEKGGSATGKKRVQKA